MELWLELQGTGWSSWELVGRVYVFLDATLSRIGALMFENAVFYTREPGGPIFEWLSAWGLNYHLILGFWVQVFRV